MVQTGVHIQRDPVRVHILGNLAQEVWTHPVEFFNPTQFIRDLVRETKLKNCQINSDVISPQIPGSFWILRTSFAINRVIVLKM
jgi:hypothetical protein